MQRRMSVHVSDRSQSEAVITSDDERNEGRFKELGESDIASSSYHKPQISAKGKMMGKK